MSYRKITAILLLTAIMLLSFVGCEGKESLNPGIALSDEEYIKQAKNYCIALPCCTFEQSETVPVDYLINYFCIYELIDEKGNFKDCYSDCIQNYPDIIIPKERVNNRLTELFDVVIDDKNSIWTDIQNPDCYNLYIMYRGARDVPQISEEKLTIENGLATLNCKVQFSTVDEEEYELNNTVSVINNIVYLTIKMTATESRQIKILSVSKQETERQGTER